MLSQICCSYATLMGNKEVATTKRLSVFLLPQEEGEVGGCKI